jgi:hypothetical protein
MLILFCGLPDGAANVAAHPIGFEHGKRRCWSSGAQSSDRQDPSTLFLGCRAFPEPPALTCRKTGPYAGDDAAREAEVPVSDGTNHGQGDAGEDGAGEDGAGEDGAGGALLRLRRAVERLEEVVAGRERLAREEAAQADALRAETRSLRDLQTDVAGRLDAAITRLKAAVGD